MFRKKRKTEDGTFKTRKRVRRASNEETENTEDYRSVAEILDEVKEDQKLRKHLNFTKKEKAASTEATSKADTNQYGLHDPKKQGSASKKLVNLLDGQFTGQSNVTQDDQYEKLKNAYVEERLKTSRPKQKKEETSSSTRTSRDEEAALYDLPTHRTSKENNDTGGDGGVLMLNTGIAEVELPDTYKQRTEQATQEALEREVKNKDKKVVNSSALPSNFSADYQRHRNEYISQLKSLDKDEKKEIGFRTIGKEQSSDDAAVARFRKFESRRRYQ